MPTVCTSAAGCRLTGCPARPATYAYDLPDTAALAVDAVPAPSQASAAAPKEAVNHPSHYGGPDNPYEVIKVLAAWGLEGDALLWNTVKYIARAGKKDPAKHVEDLEKARFYLDRRIETLRNNKK